MRPRSREASCLSLQSDVAAVIEPIVALTKPAAPSIGPELRTPRPWANRPIVAGASER